MAFVMASNSTVSKSSCPQANSPSIIFWMHHLFILVRFVYDARHLSSGWFELTIIDSGSGWFYCKIIDSGSDWFDYKMIYLPVDSCFVLALY